MARYAVSDLHGQLNLTKQVLEYIKPNDTLYYLGDAIDRGYHGYEVLKMLLEDSRVIFLLGNHEDMLLRVTCEGYSERGRENCYLWFMNGGEPTWGAINKLSQEEKSNLIQTLRKLPRRIDITNARNQKIIMTHAGLDPNMTEKAYRSIGIKDAYIWNREHSHTQWSGDEQTYALHGHTPVIEFTWSDEPPHTFFYCENHKINIDMGSYITGTAALFNIDTFETVYFKAPVEGIFENHEK